MKKIVALFMCFAFSFPVRVFADDERIFSDTVNNTYIGRSDATDLISNLNFSDVPSSHWAKESIVRSGSLNVVKGYDKTFSPNSTVANQEALAFVIRIMNMESQAIDQAVAVRNNFAEMESVRSMWSIGYISLARTLDIISYAEYQEMTTGTAATEPVTREKLAYWLAAAVNISAPNTLDLNGDIQKILTFSDWERIDVVYAKAVEAVAKAGIMKGNDEGLFKPKSGLSRAEMAQVIRNMDSIYYSIHNIEKKTGTLGGSRDNQQRETGSASVWRNYYIRTGNGGVDVLQYQMSQANPTLGEKYADVVVYKNGEVGGLILLRDGDEIEYLVDSVTEEVIYIQVLDEVIEETTRSAKLYAVDVTEGTITVQDSNSKYFIYSLMTGLYGEDYIMMDKSKVVIADIPVGSTVNLTLKNQVVESISFVGNPVVVKETRGIVTENNAEFGYITFVDNAGVFVTKNYYADSIVVEKSQYYDMEDEIGYLDEVFTSYKYDPRDTVIEDIEAGDIIFVRYDKDDSNIISMISAATNYVAKYGKIRQITYGEGLSRYLVEYETGQTNWFDVANAIFISKDGKPVTQSNVQAGDWAKFLVNQAIVQPGYVIESVKEINIEGDEHFISTIVRGQLTGIEPIQKQIMISNAQTLEKTGWGNYQNLKQISIASNDIEYYYNGTRISLDYAQQYLKRTEGDVYVALENSASGERAKMVTFRLGRDELLSPDTVITADGNGSFNILSSAGSIATDMGTIVRRHGRLVDGNSIMASDYTTVSLNDGNMAAVVDIVDAPGISNIMIARGRILSVDEGSSFKVQSMSALSGNDWVYTPIQREFTIDYNTLFFDEAGIVDQSNFLDYSENSVIDEVYNIVYEGSRAVKIVEAPFSKKAVKGTIYEISGDTIKIRDAKYYENSTGKWYDLSLKDATMTITIPTNSIVAKNNEIVTAGKLVVGDSIRAFTDTFPSKMQTGISINGYMVFVEN